VGRREWVAIVHSFKYIHTKEKNVIGFRNTRALQGKTNLGRSGEKKDSVQEKPRVIGPRSGREGAQKKLFRGYTAELR